MEKNIPDEVRKQIEEKAESIFLVGNYQILSESKALGGTAEKIAQGLPRVKELKEVYQLAAEFGYSLANKEIERLKKQIKLLTWANNL